MKKRSSHKIAVFVGSNLERQSGLIHPVLWEKENISSEIVSYNDQERNGKALALGRTIANALGLNVEDIFVVRSIDDQKRVRRLVVCLVVTSLAPLGKKVALVSRVPFPLRDVTEVRTGSIESIDSILSGRSRPQN